MAKIDITTLPDYREDMTPEEKLALYEVYELPEPQETALDTGKFIKKDMFDRVASELASAKKQLKNKMSDDEQKEAERQAAQTAMEEELKNLRKEKTISSHKASYLALGWDEKLAMETAEAMADGEFEKVFANMGKAKAALEKAFKAEALANMKQPPAGGPPDEDLEEKKQLAIIRKAMGLPNTT